MKFWQLLKKKEENNPTTQKQRGTITHVSAVQRFLLSIWYVFREHTLYNFLFTLICGYFWYKYGGKSLVYIFYLKLFTMFVISAGWYYTRIQYLYFFHNLGLSRKKLIIYALLLDWSTTILILIIINLLRN